MPPPDATPEEIGEFWDTHSLADYWDETQEVEVQVNLTSTQIPDERETLDMNTWQNVTINDLGQIITGSTPPTKKQSITAMNILLSLQLI